jgi:outer membrane biosynthesis protein TonB
VEPGDPVLFFTATEAMRRWKFEPARLDGEPVKVYYRMTFDYQIQFCPGGPRAAGR